LIKTPERQWKSFIVLRDNDCQLRVPRVWLKGRLNTVKRELPHGRQVRKKYPE
jgi:hypothetical protein